MIVLVSVIFRACALSLIYDGLSRFSRSTALQQGSASSTGSKLCSCLCSAQCVQCVRCLIWLSYNGSPEIVKSMQNVNFFNHWNKLVFDFYNHVLSISASNAEKIGINFFLELFFVCMDTNSVLRDLERAVASEDSRKTQDPLDSQSGHNQKHFSTTNPISPVH